MGTLRKIARRSFLLGTLAVGGGVAFGTYRIKTPYPNPLADEVPPGGVTFNPWIIVSPEKITLITPHADIGQGSVNVQAAMIAEEMDLEFGQFEVDFGKPDPAYWNTAFAEDGAPFRPSDLSWTAETMRGVMRGLVKALGVQGTGGSTTVPDSFVKLRLAGASARETLKEAAARRTGTPRGELTTRAGAVVLPDGTEIAYTELAAEAAGIAPVSKVRLRKPEEWRLIGKPFPRLDMVAKCTGSLPFGIDLSLEGQVLATVRLSPRRSPLQRYDDRAARAIPGVRDVLEVTNGLAVLADNTWTAFEGARALECEWAPADYPAEQEEHWQKLSESFSVAFLDAEWRADGDVEAALAAGGGTVVEAEYRAPYVAHQPLEPLNCLARVNEDGTVEVWTAHQLPRFLQQVAAQAAGTTPEKVIFHNQWGGGSFGHRLEFEAVRYAVEVAAQMPGTPIKLTFSREEDFAQDYPRHIAMGRMRGMVQGGQITAADFSIAAPSVTRSQFGRIGQPTPGPDNQIPAGIWNLEYTIPNFRTRAYAAEGLAPVSSWRSVGASVGGFFGDCFIDELIHAAGADPLEARIAMCRVGYHRKVLEAVGEMCSWGGPVPPGRARGVAFVESFGVPVAEVIEVAESPEGIRIEKVWVAADVGRVVDPQNFENQVQGGVVWGLGHAMNSEITYSDGMAEQANYYDAEGMRLNQCPQIFVRGLENNPKVRGIGEPPVPPAAPALANAIFALRGVRLREMPFNRFVEFA